MTRGRGVAIGVGGVLVFSACLIGGASPASAQALPPLTMTFDHRETNRNVTLHAVLRPNQPFTVRITNTCEAEFDYRMYGVMNSTAAPITPAGTPQLSTKELSARYDSQFGSYLVKIDRKSTARQRTCGVDLNEIELVIAVTPLEWEFGQDAALSIVPFALRKWTTEPTIVTTAGSGQPTTVTKHKVVRDGDGESVARFNFSTLTHFYAPGVNHGFALGFGLVDNSPEYYFGWSRGLGPRNSRFLNIAAGLVLTPVNMLPKDVHEDDLLDNAAIPGDFRTVHRPRAFVSFTATFFRSRENTTEKPRADPE